MSVTAPNQILVNNRLINGLSQEARTRILRRCEPVDLVFGTVLCEPDQPFTHAYFPLTGFISLVASLRDHQPLEVGLIGNEGLLGVTLALGVNSAPMRAVVQGTGTALRITAADLKHELRESVVLTRTMNRYLYILMGQLAQTAACSHFHEIEPRLARWLLMIQDRVESDNLQLTQEFMAEMLGVRRSGITVAAGALQERKLIRYSRGKIAILDRKGLEEASCECYATLIKNYAQIFEG
ncbi:MAG: Crp/Fnr family transcriptional regulator [Pseudomonadota bacterium]